MMQASSWGCACRDQHSVCIRLATNGPDASDEDTEEKPRNFRLMVGSEMLGFVPRYLKHCTEIEVKCFEQEDFPHISTSDATRHISNICTTLNAYEGPITDSVGCLIAKANPAYQHQVFVTGNLTRRTEMHSFNDLFPSSMGAHAHQFYYSQCLLSRRERLSLAVNPACSVFKYHGSWLKSDWGTKDILLIRQQDNQSISAHCAWLSLRLSEHLQSPNSSPNLWYGNNHDDNHPLFPLGLALIKLSLGCTLAKQEVSDGSNDGDDVASFGTAHQYIRFAHGESGRYADVVKRCLFWTDTADAELDDEHFQETMFVSIIMPLLDDLKAFEDVASRL